MQTFLPYPDMVASVACLDDKRLGKQRLEAKQLLRAVSDQTSGWRHHPACKMWVGYENALARYHDACILEWIRRGWKNTMHLLEPKDVVLPWWFGTASFHESHQSNLLRKDPVYYGKYGWTVGPHLPYVWPRGMAPDTDKV